MAKEKGPRFVLELDLKTELFQEYILETRFEIGRKISNACKSILLKQLTKMKKDERYQYWIKQEKSSERTEHLTNLRLEYGLSKEDAEKYVQDMGKHFLSKKISKKQSLKRKQQKKKELKQLLHLDSFTVQKIAEQCWKSVSDVLFKKGKKFHFKKYGQMTSLEGKSNTSGMRFVDNHLIWNGLSIPVQFDKKDFYAFNSLQNDIAFCRIVRKHIRGKVKYYLQVVLKGIPPQKNRQKGKEKVGLDIGISTLASVSDKQVRLVEFCKNIQPLHKETKRLQRKLDRSRRKANPLNYNTNGVVKKGKKKWIRSKNYIKTLLIYKETERKLAAKRKIAHNTEANCILKMGNEIYCEKMNYKGLQKGLFSKRMKWKAPSMFLTILNTKLGYQGKKINYINTWTVKASQYDPFLNDYQKKKLSERFHITFYKSQPYRIQRDCFSAWLIKNVNETLDKVDRNLCLNDFENFYQNYLQTEGLLKEQSKKKKLLSSIGI